MRTLCSFALLLVACDRPQPLVLCHNANCATPDISRDDTLDALAESLALTFDGKPVIDGVELDTFWYAAGNGCLFAHDLNGDTSTPASAAAQLVADHLATTPRASWNGERFYVFIELKGFVGESFDDAHTPAQMEMHADCALDTLNLIALGADAGGHALTVGFISIEPRLLQALTDRPRWDGVAADPKLEVLLVGDVFAPFHPVIPDIADYKVPLDAVEFHPRHLNAQHRETYRALGIDLVQWSFITTSESLASIERWEPKYVLTNEAPFLRRWIEN
ncbi:MAG TPA: hypothetical protein VIV11_28630 [Kofleriaceae bacterium]